MRDDFRVGLGSEPMPFGDQAALQCQIILDDAVVDNDDTSFAIPVRVRVFFRRTAMRRPSRVPDTELAGDRFLFKHIFKVLQLARASDHLELAIFDNGDSRGVISPVFE